MKKYIAIILLPACIMACKKYNNNRDDINGDLYLRGRIFLVNNITRDNEIKPVSDGIVKIGYSADNINYLYNRKADKDGYFLFEYLKKDTKYTAYTEYDLNGVKYVGKTDTSFNTSIDSAKLLIWPSEKKQNGIVYKVIDEKGGIVKNVNICLFTSPVVANDSCSGNTFSVATNEYGKADTLNIPPATYYSFFKAQFGQLILKATDTVVLPAEGIIRKTIVVKK